MQKVCHLWKQVASSPDLWSTVDLSYLKGENSAIVLSGLAKYAQGIRQLSFSRWQKLQIVSLEVSETENLVGNAAYVSDRAVFVHGKEE